MRTLYLHAGMKTKYIMNIMAFYHFHEHFSIGGCHQQSNLDNLEFIQLILKFLPTYTTKLHTRNNYLMLVTVLHIILFTSLLGKNILNFVKIRIRGNIIQNLKINKLRLQDIFYCRLSTRKSHP